MKFGKVDNPQDLDLSLPLDHPDTRFVLDKKRKTIEPKLFVGCAKWNRQELKNFYPKGTRDELAYYASQFNAIELNATFYRLFPKEQFEIWQSKVPEGFKFFPKITRMISHLKRLIDVDSFLPEYLDHISMLQENLGTVFLQMHTNFVPKDFERVVNFVKVWPKDLPVALEFRHPDWFKDPAVADELYDLMESHELSNVLVDTAGRRDIMHMRMTNDEAFIRFVGANHPSDYDRLDSWIDRLELWLGQGLRQINFFIHQNMEQEFPLLASYFIKNMNGRLGFNLKVPEPVGHLKSKTQ